MGKCRCCGMEWEAAFTEKSPYTDDPSIDTCAYCQVLLTAWRRKDKAEIKYWSDRFLRVARQTSNGEGLPMGKT